MEHLIQEYGAPKGVLAGVIQVDLSIPTGSYGYQWSSDVPRAQCPQLNEKIEQSTQKWQGYYKCMRIIYLMVAIGLTGIACWIIFKTGLEDDNSVQATKALMISVTAQILLWPVYACILKRCWVQEMKGIILQMMNQTINNQGYDMEYHKISCCYTKFIILLYQKDRHP